MSRPVGAWPIGVVAAIAGGLGPYGWVRYKRNAQIQALDNQLVDALILMANAYETMENLKNAYNLYYSLLGEYPNTQVLQNRLSSIYERQVARKR